MDSRLFSIPYPEFDYNFLTFLLKNTRFPRDVITTMLRNKEIIRVKKGLYVLGPAWQRPPSQFILANQVYGPSYISKESALSYYGLIPERVMEVSSMTTAKSKRFATSVGGFNYEHLPLCLYRVGVTRESLGDERGFLIAIPEKALVDRLRRERLTNLADLREFLEDGLRIELEALRSLRLSRLTAIGVAFPSQITSLLFQFIKELKSE